jgi:hypothetical protein
VGYLTDQVKAAQAARPGYSTPPGSPGSSWAEQIRTSSGAPGGVAPGTPDPNDPLMAPVFIGMGAGQEYQGSILVPTGDVEKTRTIDRLLREFEDMDRQQQRRLTLLLTIGGYAGSVDLEDAGKAARSLTLNDTLQAYLALLDDAAGRYARGQNVTPEQLLEQNVAYRLPRGVEWDGTYGDLTDVLHDNNIDISGIDEPEKEKDLSGTRTTTSTDTATSSNVSRDIMDPNDAMALTRAMLQRELQRDPTKAEFEDFISAVQAAQRANPTRTSSKVTRDTTTTSTTNKRGRVIDSDTDTDTSTSSTQHSGISQAGIEDVLLRRARANPDWAEWQAVGTYAPALFQALGSTVPGV